MFAPHGAQASMTPSLQVYVEGTFAAVKVVGRANFNLSTAFETLLDELYRKKFDCFMMELSECLLMDSSFLGVLVAFAVKLKPADGDGKAVRIGLNNPNPTVLQLFDDLGVLDLFQVTHGEQKAIDGKAATAVPTGASKTDITRTCLEAHRTLMAMNPDNARRFKDVTRFLAEDLKKLQGGK
jgi:anti-anti-sigma regulatory factor